MAQPNSSRTTADASSGGSTAGGTSYAGNAGNNSGQRDTTLVGRVRERAEATLESQKDRATDGLGSVARAVRSTEEQLRSQHQESIADYVSQVAERIDRFSQQLRDKRVKELFHDAQQFARRHPAAFAGSAFALGLVMSRFLKSSGDQSDGGTGYRGDAYGGHEEPRYGTSYRSPRQEARDSGFAASSRPRPSGATETSPSGTFSPERDSATASGGIGTGTAGGTGTIGTGTGAIGGMGTGGTGIGTTGGMGTGATGTGTTGSTGTGTSTGGTRGRRTGSETERS